MTSLKQLTCHLSCHVINNLPDTISELCLLSINSCDLEGCALMLPAQLQKLSLCHYGEYNIHKFSNARQLTQICDVKISSTSKFDNMESVSKLKSLIHSIPHVKNLVISLSLKNHECGMPGVEIEQFSLDNLACLKYFSPSYSQSDTTDLSNLPHCLNFRFSLSTKLLIGQFPSCLESLDISLSEYNEPFEGFWKRFISPLKNLFFLKANISQRGQIDFRGLEFPPRLHTVEIFNYPKRAPCHLNFD
ncbi:unnamed protein product [Ambrosiozyma monospora]|uniref:Unnamed protein product n=1 Tax=Ambrosiozyma monospora TaxID=43982 RepID=A0ACB5SW00_AMBMO|nr:unnamed protein product [Ambrosiozyma monospora]